MFRSLALASLILFSGLAGAQTLEHPWEPPCSYPDWPSLGELSIGKAERPHRSAPLQSTYLGTGEFVHDAVDLRIAGRGLDVVIARRYRSRLGARSVMGYGWSFSYDIAARPAAGGLTLRDGHGRNDVFAQQLDGSFTAAGVPMRGVLNGDGTYTFTFPDAGKWNLRALDGSPAQGKLASIVDRNGNTISFAYNGAGRLTTITDTLGRNVTLAYNAAGRIASVTDFAGRQVVYSYFAPGDPDGDVGDLKSVRSPVVTGTPNNFNDWPAGKTTSYTYAVGQPRTALDHNLLTTTDPAGKRLVRNTFDAADELVKQELGTTGESLEASFAAVAPASGNGFATHVAVVNDRAGDVSEHYFDALNRLVLLREFTGRATAGIATTLAANRPINKLRTSDPDFFETKWEYDANSLVTRRVDPELDETLLAYPTSGSVLARFNVLTRTDLAGPRGGDQVSHLWSFAYDAAHNLPLQVTDPRGIVTTHVRDANGNCTKTTRAIASVVDDFEFNAFGQMTAHVLPADATGFRRRDEFHYYASGPQKGYLQDQVVDAGTGPSFLRLTTTYEYDSLGRTVRTIDPRGNDTLFDFNALGQVVRERSRAVGIGADGRYEKLFFFDLSDNLQFIDVENVDAAGDVAANPYLRTTFEYDGLNRLTRKRVEIAIGQEELTEYAYDANGNRSIERFHAAATGALPNNLVLSLFDERDLVFQAKRAPGAMWHSTTQFDYDKNGKLVVTREGLESNPRVSSLVHDGFDRVVQRTDAMGNVETLHYDANGNQVSRRLDGELADVPGSAGNVRLEQSSAVFDALDRVTSRTRLFFDPLTQTNYGSGSSVESFVLDGLGGAVSRTDPTGGVTTQQFDHAHRVSLVTDAKSNSVACQYDPNGNVTRTTETHKADSGAPDVVFVVDNVFDVLDRIKETRRQNGTTKCTCSFDSRNNVVRSTDELDNVTTHAYDGLSRCVSTARELRAGGTGSGALLSVQLTTFVWKQLGLLASTTDDNGHTTQFQYDDLNRLVATLNADGTINSQDFNVHDDAVLVTDANGSQTTSVFDALGRATSRSVSTTPPVLPETTAESFVFDGRSLLVSAQDDDSLVQREHDSLGALRRETATIGIGWPNPTTGTTSITTDAAGAWTQLVYPGGRTVNATRDALHRATMLADGVGTFSIGPIDHLGPLGMPGCSLSGSRIERIAASNNTRSTFSYDNLLRPTQALTKFDPNGANLTRVQRTASWTADDGLAARANSMTQAGSTSFAYSIDSLGRLSQSGETPQVGPAVTIAYALDDVGSRTLVTGGADAGAYAMSCVTPVPADCQVNQYTQTPFDDRIYDPNGNVLQLYGLGAAADVASYDFANRLCRYVDTSAGQTHIYKYDALGRRIAKIVDSTGAASETRFFHLGAQVIEEQSKLGATLATYVSDIVAMNCVRFDGFEWGFGVMSMRRGATNYFLHRDAVGNVAAVTNNAGAVVERYDYEDFGQPRIRNGSGQVVAQSAIGNPCLRRGAWLDAETGLFLHGDGRCFDPRAARMLQRGVDSSVKESCSREWSSSVTVHAGAWTIHAHWFGGMLVIDSVDNPLIDLFKERDPGDEDGGPDIEQCSLDYRVGGTGIAVVHGRFRNYYVKPQAFGGFGGVSWGGGSVVVLDGVVYMCTAPPPPPGPPSTRTATHVLPGGGGFDPFGGDNDEDDLTVELIDPDLLQVIDYPALDLTGPLYGVSPQNSGVLDGFQDAEATMQQALTDLGRLPGPTCPRLISIASPAQRTCLISFLPLFPPYR